MIRTGTVSGNISPEEVRRVNAVLANKELPMVDLSQFDPGLAIIRGIIDLHGGWVRLEDVDDGCMFSIGLPASESED